VNEIASNPNVHSDVIQVAERVLQRLEATHELLPAPSGSFTGKNILEELACVSQLLGGNPELVQSPWIERLDPLAAFQDLLPPAIELLVCRLIDRPPTQRSSSTGDRAARMPPY
jgi:hypothetical protein